MGGPLQPQTGAEALARAALAVATRMSAGGTLWCASPEWPWHARHVAVEFVHPVIVGKRALPAIALDTPGWVADLRTGSRPGDVFLAVGSAGRPVLAEAARRARIWGLTTIWAGAGAPMAPDSADHVLWAGDDPFEAAFGGALVRTYHLLWELVHVCFEHPGLLVPGGPARDSTDGSAMDCGTGGHCITCSDEGRPAEVLHIGADHTASVRSSLGVEEIDITLVDEPGPGDLLLVHAGTALTVLERAGTR